MKIPAVILALTSLLLTACNQNKPAETPIPVVGEAVDSAAIAQDTLGQKSLDASYEYAQTVVVNPNLVYDIRAYGGPPSHGEYAILRRGADNKADTVAVGERFGTIVNAFTADLNHNGKEEIYVVMRTPQKNASSYIVAFEFEKKGNATPLKFKDGQIEEGGNIDKPSIYNDNGIVSSDTIYTYAAGIIVKKFRNDFHDLPGMPPPPPPIAWKLIGTKLALLTESDQKIYTNY